MINCYQMVKLFLYIFHIIFFLLFSFVSIKELYDLYESWSKYSHLIEFHSIDGSQKSWINEINKILSFFLFLFTGANQFITQFCYIIWHSKKKKQAIFALRNSWSIPFSFSPNTIHSRMINRKQRKLRLPDHLISDLMMLYVFSFIEF